MMKRNPGTPPAPGRGGSRPSGHQTGSSKPPLKHAVVLSGGGSNGAYEVGVLRALLGGLSPSTDHQALEPDIYTGTSVGSYNATLMASQPASTAAESVLCLEELWRRRIAQRPGSCGSGVFRIRLGPLRLLDLSCLEEQPLRTVIQAFDDTLYYLRYGLTRGLNFFTPSHASLDARVAELVNVADFICVDPLAALVNETLDMDSLRFSDKSLYIAVSDWHTGRLRIYDKAAIADRLQATAILASAAIPGVFPPVAIEGAKGVDGGLLMNSPLAPAIDAGAHVLHVVYVDPRVRHLRESRLPSTSATMARILSILATAQIRDNVVWIERFQQGEFQGRLAKLKRQFENLVVHSYRPSKLKDSDLLLDFSLARVERLIELGYRETVEHDCEAAGCRVGGVHP